MPKRSRSYRKRPRSAKRRRIVKTRKSTLTRQIGPAFSNAQLVKLRYCARVTIDAAVGAFALTNFRANSLFDPDHSGVGHQPLGFDQWSAFYDHYNVIGSKIAVTFCSPGGSTNTDTGICGVILDDDLSGFASTTTELIEQGKAKWRYLTTSQGLGRVVVRKGFSAKKFFNVQNIKDNVDRLGAQTGSNPTEEAFFRVFVGPRHTALDPAPIDCIVQIDYIAMFTEPKNLAQS